MNKLKEISTALARVDDPVLIESFLKSLLTKSEIHEMSARWALVKLLWQGHTQRAIAYQLKLSLCKITRGSKELKKRNSSFKKMLEIQKEANGASGSGHPET